MNRWLRFLGYLGVVLFVFGLIGGFVIGFGVENPVQTLMVLQIIVGLGLIIAWCVLVGFQTAGSAGAVIRGRTVRFGVSALAYGTIFLGLLVALNYLVARHEIRWDLTEQGVYSLAPQSQKILGGLKKPLHIVAIKTGRGDDAAKDLLGLVSDSNSQIKVEFMDPQSQPYLIEKYGMKAGNTLYLEYGEGTNTAVSRLNEITEEALVNGVIKLTRGEAKKVYYVEGHDEPDIASDKADGAKQLADAIGDEHLTVQGMLLASLEEIPSDAAAVILCSPKKPLLPQEKQMLINYIDKGGRVVLLTDPRTTGDVREIAAHVGITIGNDIVVDQVQRLFAGPALGVEPVVREYGAHAITQNFGPKHITIFNQAESVTVPTEEPKDGVQYTALAKTGETAWAEKNLPAIFDEQPPSAQLDADDTAGPITLAAVYEKNLDAGEKPKDSSTDEVAFKNSARVVVFGDSDWLLNGNFASYANRDFALNTVNWVVGEEGGISIRPRSIRTPELSPFTREGYMIMLASSFLIPELLFIFGLIVWWNRRTSASAGV